MRRDIAALESGPFDVLIVGGGINGAGIARDAAMRGLRVALVERADFGSGTSSRSSKLVHGGIRYLEQRDFRLVREASRERSILLRIAPHLVRPLPFLIPIYEGDARGPALIRLGLWLYDALALFRNSHPHRMLRPAEALDLEPALRRHGLRAVALYYDAQMDDARLCLANIVSAAGHGAAVVNYAEVTALLNQDGRTVGAAVLDRLSGARLTVRARRVVNAAGPWLDQLCALDSPQPAKLRLTKGTHIFVPALTRRFAVTIPATDNRVIFAIPWGESTLIGTTDTDYDGDPGAVLPDGAEIDYLLEEVTRILPGHGLTRDSVLSAFAGVRPLASEEGMAPGQVSREHRISESPSGLISLSGGKYTTYREVAKQVVDRFSSAACRTDQEPLPGGGADFDAFRQEMSLRLQARFGVEARTAEELISAYGSEAYGVLDRAPGQSVLAARVRYSVELESALTLEDVMRRRTQLAFGHGSGMPLAVEVSRLMAPLLGWDEPERLRQVEAYAASVGFGIGTPLAGR